MSSEELKAALEDGRIRIVSYQSGVTSKKLAEHLLKALKNV